MDLESIIAKITANNEQEVEEAKKEYFEVTDEKSADWVLQKINENNRQKAEVHYRAEAKRDELRQKWLDPIDEWEAKENKKIDDSNGYLTMLLDNYMQKDLSKNPKFKLSSPFGKLSTRKYHKFAWPKDTGNLIKQYQGTDAVTTKYALNKTNLKKRLVANGNQVIDKETGEVLAGVSYQEGKEITIKPSVSYEDALKEQGKDK